jgi:hypothetical protein
MAAKAMTTMIVNHNRVRPDMRAPCLYTKKSPAREAGATYSGQDYSLTGESCQKKISADYLFDSFSFSRATTPSDTTPLRT